MSGIESWSTNPANNNQATPYGWPAGMLPSQVEPTARQTMASIAAWYQAAQWINYNAAITYLSATQFTVPGNLTTTYQVGRRVQATDGTTSVYGTITASAFTTLTTVTVSWDSGSLPTGVTVVYVGIISASNSSLPPLASTAFANPSGSIGLTAVNGTAVTAMRSDAAPPLSQAIAPTWTGNHTFNPTTGTSTFKAAAATVAVTIISSNSATQGTSDLIIQRAGSTANALAEGPNLQLNDTANATGTILQNSGGQSELWQLNGGTWRQIATVGASDFNLRTRDDGGTQQQVGWRDLPNNLIGANYTVAHADRGKVIQCNASNLTITFPNDSTFPIGTVITIDTGGATGTTLAAAASASLLWYNGSGSTGNRSVAAFSVVTVMYHNTSSGSNWAVMGSGLS